MQTTSSDEPTSSRERAFGSAEARRTKLTAPWCGDWKRDCGIKKCPVMRFVGTCTTADEFSMHRLWATTVTERKSSPRH
jgi:hypothetical protein